ATAPARGRLEGWGRPHASRRIAARLRLLKRCADERCDAPQHEAGRESPRLINSRALDSLDDRIPFGELVLEVLVRALRAVAEHRLQARLDELLLERLVGPFLLRHVIEPLEDRLRRADRGENAKEDLRDEMVEALLVRGRDVGRRLDPSRRVDREDAKLAG